MYGPARATLTPNVSATSTTKACSQFGGRESYPVATGITYDPSTRACRHAPPPSRVAVRFDVDAGAERACIIRAKR